MIHDGLPVYKYIFKNGSLDNGADNPENKCFCRKNKCLKPGLIDVTDCFYGKIKNILDIFIEIMNLIIYFIYPVRNII